MALVKLGVPVVLLNLQMTSLKETVDFFQENCQNIINGESVYKLSSNFPQLLTFLFGSKSSET